MLRMRSVLRSVFFDGIHDSLKKITKRASSSKTYSKN